MNLNIQSSIFKITTSVLFFVLLGSIQIKAQECMLVCPNIPVSFAPAGSCNAAVTGLDATITGTCLSTPSNQNGIYPIGETEVVFSATNSNNEIITCTTVVIVRDVTAPIISNCQNISDILDVTDCGSLFTIPFSYTDNCNSQPLTLNQSINSNSVNNSWLCASGNTNYLRVFNSNTENLYTGLDITSVEFFVSNSQNNAPVQVNIYDLQGNVSTGTFTLLANASMTIPNVSNQMVSIPISANISANTTFAVEIIVPGSILHGTVIGLNDNGETAPTYYKSESCGEDNYKLLSDDIAGYGVVMGVNGDKPAMLLRQLDNTGYYPGDLLDVGTYYFEFDVIDASGNISSKCEFSHQVIEYSGTIPAIACNNTIQISLDQDCEIIVTPDMVLEGADQYCLEGYTVNITNQNGTSYGNTLSYINLGQTLTAEVTGPHGNSCWSTIELEDKAPPPLECIDVYTTCSGSVEPGQPVSEEVTYRANISAANSILPVGSTVSRIIDIEALGLHNATVTNIAVKLDISHTNVSDLSATITSPSGITRTLMFQPGIGCNEDNINVRIDPRATLTATDLNSACSTANDVAITGSYKPTDNFSVFNGAEAHGSWRITIHDLNNANGGTINNVELSISQNGGVISFPTTNTVTFTATGDNTFRVNGIDPCGSSILGYEDEYQEVDCDGPYDKIIHRKWFAEDMSGNEALSCTQNIYVYRNGIEGLIFPPDYDGIDEDALSCSEFGDEVPGVDITGNVSGEICDIFQMFPPQDTRLDVCQGSYKIIRYFKAIQWCSGEVVEHNQVIKVIDNDGPEVEDVEDITISTDLNHCTATYAVTVPEVTKDCSENFTYQLYHQRATHGGAPSTTGDYTNEGVSPQGSQFTISPLPYGRSWIKWIVTDNCNNSTEKYASVTVEDQVTPTAVCDEFTVVSLGGNGEIIVDASTFDDGSHDNCGIFTFEAAKMTNQCSNGNTSFQEKITFCCEEIGNPVMVQFRVTDNFGNSNTCMVEVSVQDKLPPYITYCPEDVELDCHADYEDLSMTGEAIAIDNCSVASLEYKDSGTISSCGEGEITRTWTAVDEAGFKNSCIQVITLNNNDDFRESDIRWPFDYDTETCSSNLNPENLPSVYREPTFNNVGCSLVAATYKDQTFTFVDEACVKILRTWTVIDWCTYDDTQTENTDGLYEHTQIIKLANSRAPSISNCQDREVQTFGDCSGVFDFTVLATDDCTPETQLEYRYEIDLDNDGSYDLSGNSARINRTLSNGTHKIQYWVEDNCGNTSNCEFLVTLVDGKKPTPYCRATVVTATMNSTGMVSIWASDFNIGSFDNCTADEDLRISFSTNVNDIETVLSCDDIPNNEEALIPLKMYVTDEAGNYDFCDVEVHLQDNLSDYCQSEGNMITLSGTLESQYQKPLSQVEVAITNSSNGQTAATVYTDENGKYTATGLPQSNNYSIRATKNDGVRNGVNTLDLVKIQRHILGLEVLDNPFDIIASDINNDEKIKPSDLLTLRKLILGLIHEFPNEQKSWRFIPYEYEFADLSNPFPYDDAINMIESQFSNNYQNMVAVKIGDLDNSVEAFNSQKESESRSTQKMELIVENQNLQSGTTVSVPVYSSYKGLFGYQFTLETNGLNFKDISSGTLNMTNENIGIFEGKITTSWSNSQPMDVNMNEPLFTLIFDVTENTTIENALSISSDITTAAAFNKGGQVLDLVLKTRSEESQLDKFVLYQNTPNPFTTSTSISFYLPTPQEVQLKIYDVTGKKVYSATKHFLQGKQSFDIDESEFASIGLHYYEVSAGADKATMKMVLVK